jgi:hypothetical protein
VVVFGQALTHQGENTSNACKSRPVYLNDGEAERLSTRTL